MSAQVARDPGDTVRAGSLSPSEPSSFAKELRETEGTVRKRLLWAAAVIGLLILLGACAPNATQDTLQPKGPYAEKVKDLFIPVFWVAVGVFVIVEGAIVWISIRFRHRKGRERMPAQTHGNTRLEIGWTIAPALILAGVMVPDHRHDLGSRPQAARRCPQRHRPRASSGGGASSTRTQTCRPTTETVRRSRPPTSW